MCFFCQTHSIAARKCPTEEKWNSNSFRRTKKDGHGLWLIISVLVLMEAKHGINCGPFKPNRNDEPLAKSLLTSGLTIWHRCKKSFTLIWKWQHFKNIQIMCHSSAIPLRINIRKEGSFQVYNWHLIDFLWWIMNFRWKMAIIKVQFVVLYVKYEKLRSFYQFRLSKSKTMACIFSSKWCKL